MRNHEIVQPGLLLDEQGELREPGWARSQLLRYKRSMIGAPAIRIKEWDYYLVLADGFAGAFTISDDGYIGLQSVSLLVFGEKPLCDGAIFVAEHFVSMAVHDKLFSFSKLLNGCDPKAYKQ